MGKLTFLFRIFFVNVGKRLNYLKFSEKFSKLMYQKLWFFLFEKLEWKIGQKPLFSRFWDEQAFRKISENLFLVRLKTHHLTQKLFQNVFSSPKISSSKLKYFFAKVFVFFFINFFIVIFTILDSGRVGLTEKV